MSMKKHLWMKKIKDRDIMYVRERFDVSEWWRQIGSIKFPKLAISALIVLGKPSHNAFQERVFSVGNWTDSKLRKKRKAENFEINLLEACNAEYFNKLDIIDGNYMQDKQTSIKTVKDFFIQQKDIEENLETDDESLAADKEEEVTVIDLDSMNENDSLNDTSLDLSFEDVEDETNE
jgi:hAT family C-terminal dimerisation region